MALWSDKVRFDPRVKPGIHADRYEYILNPYNNVGVHTLCHSSRTTTLFTEPAATVSRPKLLRRISAFMFGSKKVERMKSLPRNSLVYREPVSPAPWALEWNLPIGCRILCVIFEVLTAVVMKICAVYSNKNHLNIWRIISLQSSGLKSKRTWCLLHAGFLLGLHISPKYGSDNFLRNVGWLSPHYTELYPRRQTSSCNVKFVFHSDLCTLRRLSKCKKLLHILNTFLLNWTASDKLLV
jgi:hypothetical protein